MPDLFEKKSLRSIFGPYIQDTFDHDKGQESAISVRRLHWIFFEFSPVDFFRFSPGSLCNLVRKWPLNVEKIDFRGREKSVESCHVCGCHGSMFLGARLRGRTATQRSKKGSEKVLERVLGKGSGEGFWGRVLRRGSAMGFTVKKGCEKGSQKGF